MRPFESSRDRDKIFLHSPESRAKVLHSVRGSARLGRRLRRIFALGHDHVHLLHSKGTSRASSSRSGEFDRSTESESYARFVYANESVRQDTIRVEPRDFAKPPAEAIKEEIHRRYSNKVDSS